MNIELQIELPVADAAAVFPRRNGKKVHVLTVKRWITKGCRGVYLVGWKRGNNWFTSAEAIEQFRRDCTRKSVTATVRSSDQVSRAVSTAREQLRRKGFYGKEGKNKGNQGQEMLGMPVGGRNTRPVPSVLPGGLSGCQSR